MNKFLLELKKKLELKLIRNNKKVFNNNLKRMLFVKKKSCYKQDFFYDKFTLYLDAIGKFDNIPNYHDYSVSI